MGKWFRFCKRSFVIALSIALVGSTVDLTAFDVLAENQTVSLGSDNGSPLYEESVLLAEAETSAMGIGFFSLADGNVTLKDGNWEEWIDRLDLSDVEFCTTLYENLIEASDNDGVDDWLIDDDYFNQDTHRIAVATGTEQVATQAEISTAMNEVLARYSSYIVAVTNAFDRDHPEVFWLNGQTSATISVSGSGSDTSGWTCTYTIYLRVKDSGVDIRATAYQSQEKIEAGITARDTRVNALVNAASGMSDYEKIVYFNQQLTTTNEYNTSSDLSSIDNDCLECISALIGKTGTDGPVCEGYARAFKVLCDASDIPCVLVSGYAKNSSTSEGEAHMWNYVKLDGNWYAVDVTWNDPVVNAGADGAVSGYEGENWLLVGSQTEINGLSFEESHPAENQVSSTGIAFTNGPVLYTEKYEVPVATPTPVPTAAPTAAPTAVPTATPTATPTVAPTATPTVAPTATPTVAPTATPTAAPTATPTATPTVAPSTTPTATPTVVPTATPTVAPTATPTAAPTATPTVAPTAVPTATPTVAPTATPTVAPTATPTVAPTATPTATPTAAPTVAPTAAPTATPTAVPTATPTVAPTATPTVAPTAVPTATPTVTPTATPTAVPTAAPTATPTVAPTATPTAAPTVAPTAVPTAVPTAAPTATPTAAPTAVPTAAPTVAPTAVPTAVPTATPTVAPTAAPTVAPTAVPTAAPTAKPAAAPTTAPTASSDNWTAVSSQAQQANAGSAINVHMNNTTVVPGNVLQGIKGKDISLTFAMPNGTSWTVNGLNVTSDNVQNIDFNVIVEDEQTVLNNIPQKLLNSVVGNSQAVDVSLSYSGPFGFSAVLSIPLKAENAGKYAKLYYYNEAQGKLEYVGSSQIQANGVVQLVFTHASEYTIVIEDDPTVAAPITAPKTGEDGSIGVVGILMIGAIALIVGMYSTIIIRRKMEEE